MTVDGVEIAWLFGKEKAPGQAINKEDNDSTLCLKLNCCSMDIWKGSNITTVPPYMSTC